MLTTMMRLTVTGIATTLDRHMAMISSEFMIHELAFRRFLRGSGGWS
jgi:hypothetical protein